MLPSPNWILLCVNVRKCLDHHHVLQDGHQHVPNLIRLRSLPNSVCHNLVDHSKDVV
jgi:hypothetical protein